MLAWLPLRAERGSLSDTAAWAIERNRRLADQPAVKSVVDVVRGRGRGAKMVAEFVGDDVCVERLRVLSVDCSHGPPSRMGESILL